MDRQGTVQLPSGEVAHWHILERMLYVRHRDCEKSSELGGFRLYPQALASILLSEMVLDGEQHSGGKSH